MLILVLSALSMVLAALKRPACGLATYFIIRLCVPISARLWGFSFSTCTLALLLLTCLPALREGLRECSAPERDYFRIYGSLAAVLLLLSLIPNYVPRAYQIGKLLQFCMTELVPACLVVLLVRRREDFVMLNKAVLVAGLFTACYGIFTFAANSNPLFSLFAADDTTVRDFSGMVRSGISGRAVGIYNDKIFLSLVSLVLLTYFSGKDFLGKGILRIFLLLTLLDLVLTLQRTGIFAAVLFALVMAADPRHRRAVIRSAAACIVGFAALALLSPRLGGLRDFMVSSLLFWNDGSQASAGVSGSSVALRLSQFSNVWALVRSHALQGMGYAFTGYYYTEVWDAARLGLNPEFCGFESFALKVVVSSGLLGAAVWCRSLWRMSSLMRGGAPMRGGWYCTAFFIAYIAAVLMTDTSGSMYLFFTCVSLNYLYYKFYPYENRPCPMEPRGRGYRDHGGQCGQCAGGGRA